MDTLQLQYQLIREARSALLTYCEGISEADLARTNSSFGHESMANLLAHIVNCYLFWIGETALRKRISYIAYTNSLSIIEIKARFDLVDTLMIEFFQLVDTENPSEIPYTIREYSGTATPLKLFTHVTTHEFHHKGQILSLSRHLGYIPADTDVMR